MNVTYDSNTDTLTVVFKPGPVAESDEGKNGVILDYDEEGDLVSLEILDASKKVPDYATLQFKVA
ncbi:MAG: DUF2283 domain-containing protein [Desulfomonilaceae bacterium]|jgi:uncharacterized protein YuzE